ncbi:MAG: EAL domain-containing protein, partial [Clostridia bacterium]|nr:EAL domain-containing protein [Clostridia bacterium]
MSESKAKLPLNVKKQILVVDDEIINREILGALLRDEYEIIYAADGQEAIEQVRRYKDTLSLCLLDLKMPVMSGMVVLKLLSDDPELSRIPIMVMTADQESEVACLELGALDFIPKPYPRRDIVLARVHRTIELSEDRQIIRSTERDPLTGLYNREYFYSYAESFDQHHKSIPMDAIVVDVNHFHMLNERYGRAYADQVLQEIGSRLRENVRANGGIVCRREADTFLVYCPHRDDYRQMLSSVDAGLRNIESSQNRVRLRMGVYPKADKAIEMEQRFDRAKTAADAVRSNYTQNISIYDEKLHENELFSEQLIEEFDSAIQARQFKVYYQPKFDIRPEKPILTSAEALVRWQHPRLGLISPGVFIPLFEGNGMIQKLDKYVWAEAAAQVRRWKDAFGISVPVSVNVSRVDMFDPALVSTFEHLLQENRLEPDDLLLEITESAYTDDADFIISTVNALRDLGLKVEMDDFGTGYSSLGMISHLPIDALKLDMTFVRNAFGGEGDVRMLELIIDIADYLDVPVIAEGVETKEQLNALKTMGCDIVQGYYFSKPVPPEAFDAFVAEKKRQLDSLAHASLSQQSEKSILHFSSALQSRHYDSLYYIDLDSGYYMEFGTQSWHESLSLQKGGEDFFGDLKRDISRVVFPEDRENMLAFLDRQSLRERLQQEGEASLACRLMINGQPKLYHLKAAHARAGHDQHIVIAVSSVERGLSQGMSETHENAGELDLSSIASMASGKYDTICYVDS